KTTARSATLSPASTENSVQTAKARPPGCATQERLVASVASANANTANCRITKTSSNCTPALSSGATRPIRAAAPSAFTRTTLLMLRRAKAKATAMSSTRTASIGSVSSSSSDMAQVSDCEGFSGESQHRDDDACKKRRDEQDAERIVAGRALHRSPREIPESRRLRLTSWVTEGKARRCGLRHTSPREPDASGGDAVAA